MTPLFRYLLVLIFSVNLVKGAFIISDSTGTPTGTYYNDADDFFGIYDAATGDLTTGDPVNVNSGADGFAPVIPDGAFIAKDTDGPVQIEYSLNVPFGALPTNLTFTMEGFWVGENNITFYDGPGPNEDYFSIDITSNIGNIFNQTYPYSDDISDATAFPAINITDGLGDSAITDITVTLEFGRLEGGREGFQLDSALLTVMIPEPSRALLSMFGLSVILFRRNRVVSL